MKPEYRKGRIEVKAGENTILFAEPFLNKPNDWFIETGGGTISPSYIDRKGFKVDAPCDGILRYVIMYTK
jgi:hypothetical protein